MNTFAHAGFWPVIPMIWGLFWIAVVALAVWTWRRGVWGRRGRPAETRPTAPAEQILAERYARGEMSDDEYLERMSVLRGGA
ncbi:SHOCT domain-containing protein [Nonomuraea sp. NPDC003214]